MRYRHFFFLSILCLLSFFGAQSRATSLELIIGGSTTVESFVFKPHYNAIASDVGFDFHVDTSNSGMGVMSLLAGYVDIAAISSDFPSVIKSLEQKKGVRINQDNYNVHKISVTKVLYAVHPANPLKALSPDQLKKVLMGEISDWSHIGVDGLGEIKVITEPESGGLYNTVVKQVTGGVDITKNKVVAPNALQGIVLLSEMPNGFTILSDATSEEERRGISLVDVPNFEAVQEMYFVTKKNDDRDDVHAIIRSVQKIVQ